MLGIVCHFSLVTTIWMQCAVCIVYDVSVWQAYLCCAVMCTLRKKRSGILVIVDDGIVFVIVIVVITAGYKKMDETEANKR